MCFKMMCPECSTYYLAFHVSESFLIDFTTSNLSPPHFASWKRRLMCITSILIYEFSVLHQVLFVWFTKLCVIDKLSWSGCGSHVPGVMDSIPEDQWCTVSLLYLSTTFTSYHLSVFSQLHLPVFNVWCGTYTCNKRALAQPPPWPPILSIR